MRMTKAQTANKARLIERLTAIGFNLDEINAMLRIEKRLQRWGEMECGTVTAVGASLMVQVSEETGECVQTLTPRGCKPIVSIVENDELKALAELAEIMKAHPTLKAFHQGDCRGCNLYIIRPDDVPQGKDVSAYYDRGIGVCY